MNHNEIEDLRARTAKHWSKVTDEDRISVFFHAQKAIPLLEAMLLVAKARRTHAIARDEAARLDRAYWNAPRAEREAGQARWSAACEAWQRASDELVRAERALATFEDSLLVEIQKRSGPAARTADPHVAQPEEDRGENR